MSSAFWIFLILCLSSLSSALGQQQSRLSSAADLAALYSLRASLGLRARNWPRRADPCSAWAGVGCRLGRVETLNLSGLRRTRLGRLDPRFAVDGARNLTRLSVFNATGFALPGPIPAWFVARLSVLVLKQASVTGTLPEFDTASGLTVFDLSGNSIAGTVPPSLGTLGSLKTLNLAGNRLSGPISPQLKNLRSLQELDISRNNFSDALPESLWSLPELAFLDASHNSLTGKLPATLPANAHAASTGSAVDISNNLFYGPVTSRFGLFLLSKFNSVDLSDNYLQGSVPVEDTRANVSFRSNCFWYVSNQRSSSDCEEFYKERGLPYDSPAPTSSSQKTRGWRLKYTLICVFGGIALLVFFFIVFIFCLMRRRKKASGERESNTNAVPSGANPPSSGASVNLPAAVGDSFTYEQLLLATKDFNDANVIKHGHSGVLYRGVLEDAVPIVVKRIDARVVKREAYVVELDFFAKTTHERLIPFLGHCFENENEKLLVYKYMPNGDLSNALFRKREEEGLQSLDWITRLKIATGVAEALCFLHHECPTPLVHRDVQASSILLDDKFEVRMGSLSEVCTQEGDGRQNAVSRFLRLSTHSTEKGTATCAHDVYCFGKVLIELVTGKLGVSGSADALMVEWLDHTLPFISVYEKELVTKIVDPSLIIDEDLLEEVWAIAIVAKSCLNRKPSKRPLVKYVLKALENPLKVVRQDSSSSDSAPVRATSSRWGPALFGSWRHSSAESTAAGPGQSSGLKRSGTMRSQGSGDNSGSHRKSSKEIFPEPLGALDLED